MGKVVFRPFWSYDVLKTERWLGSMQAKGYELEKINISMRLFYFREVEASECQYRIVYEQKTKGNIATNLINCGYERVCWSDNYYVVRNRNQNSEEVPSYLGFLNKNQGLQFGVKLALSLTVGILVFLQIVLSAVAFFIINLLADGEYDIKDPMSRDALANALNQLIITDVVIVVASIFVLTWLIYTTVKLRITNQQLEKVCVEVSNRRPKIKLLSNTQEKALKLENKLIKKKKWGWFFAPDKLERWLEGMESKGYQLYRINKSGNSFYFLKGAIRKVKYCVDVQNDVKPQYFDLHVNNGWKMMYTTSSIIQSMNVWSQEYSDSLPMFYCNKANEVKRAKSYAILYSVCALLMLICFLTIFITSLMMSHFEFSLFVLLFLIFVHGSLAIRSLAYYKRIKK